MKKLFNLIKKIIYSNLGILKRPYKITFAITYRCNSRCTTCNIWKKPVKKELSLEEIQNFFKENNYFSWVDIGGGEIFLRKDVVEIAETIIKNCKNLYFLHFPTNGLMPEIIAKKTEEISKLHPNKLIISVSLDGTKDLYKKIRGVDGWGKAIKTFKLLRKIPNVEVYFGMTLSKENYNKIEDTIKEVKKEIPNLKYKDFHVNIVHYSGHYYENTKEIKDYPKKEVFDNISKFLKKKGLNLTPIGYIERKYQNLINKYFKKEKTPVPCQAAKSSCFIDPYGNVYACNIDNFVLGNIKKQKFSEIWESDKAKKIRQLIKEGNCVQCWTPCEAYQSILGNMFKINSLRKLFKYSQKNERYES